MHEVCLARNRSVTKWRISSWQIGLFRFEPARRVCYLQSSDTTSLKISPRIASYCNWWWMILRYHHLLSKCYILYAFVHFTPLNSVSFINFDFISHVSHQEMCAIKYNIFSHAYTNLFKNCKIFEITLWYFITFIML